jgi:pantoate--beta-alanine ligase
MEIVKKIKRMQAISRRIRNRAKTVGLIPTMGALHEGHLSLIRQARKENDFVVVSIFVNPIQFAPAEDFKQYPRPIKQDIALCLKEKVDFFFLPAADEVYPVGFKTYVGVEELSDVLCGAERKNHFRGVTTVVSKLFHIVQPDSAYFGQKDAQQATIIKQMVRDLNMPVTIKVMPTVRHQNGLALSSRNVYLGAEDRKRAACLSESLMLAQRLVRAGEKDSGSVINKMRQILRSQKNINIEYIAIVDLDNLKPVEKIAGNCLVALAVRIGKTRLIDNMVIKK